MAHFVPALGEHVDVPQIARSYRFLACLPPHDDRTPQVYSTHLGDWQATSFRRATQRDLLHTGATWFVDVVLSDEDVDYTYRFVRSDGGIDWCGSPGSNGRIRRSDVAASSIDVTLVSHTAEPADDQGTVALASPVWHVAGGLALVRNKPTWIEPQRVEAISDVSEQWDTQLLILHDVSRKHVVVFLPLSTTACSSAIRRQGDHLVLRYQRDLGDAQCEALAVSGEARIDQVHDLVAKLVAEGRRAVAKANGMNVEAHETEPQRHGLRYVLLSVPSFTGDEAMSPCRYCTWNALGNWYSGQQAADIVGQLFERDPLFGKAVDAILLDDGWQDIRHVEHDQRRLRSFGAHVDFGSTAPDSSPSPERPTTRRHGDSGFSSPTHDAAALDEEHRALDGLAKGIRLVRKRLPTTVVDIGVWLTLEGYWDGCDPDGPLSHHFGRLVKYKHRHASKSPWFLPHVAQFDRFWRSYFVDLKDAGVSYVKVDNQAWIDEGLDPELRVLMSRSMIKAAKDIFGRDDAVIHCMAMSPRIMTGALGLGMLTTVEPPFRNSDDFFPDQPDSHGWHIIVNAMNTILTKHLSFTLDFDMFQTGHEWGVFHAVFRTFSPSPIYVTDTLDSHDSSLVRRLVAPQKDGKLAAVQSYAHKPTILAEDVFLDFQHGHRALKLGVQTAGGAVIGIFNCLAGDRDADAVLYIDEVFEMLRSLPPDSTVVVRHESRGTSTFLRSDMLHRECKQIAALQLAPRSCEIVTIAPMGPLANRSKIGCVGLVDKLNPLMAIRKVESTAALTSAAAPRAALAPPSPRLPSPSTQPPELGDFALRLRDHLLEPELHGRLRSKPMATMLEETRYLIRVIFSYAALLMLHLFSVALSRAPTAIPASRSPFLLEKDPFLSAGEKARSVYRVDVDLAGKLGFVVLDGPPDRIDFYLDGASVARDYLEIRGDEPLIVLDMEKATAGSSHAFDNESWVIEAIGRV